MDLFEDGQLVTVDAVGRVHQYIAAAATGHGVVENRGTKLQPMGSYGEGMTTSAARRYIEAVLRGS